MSKFDIFLSYSTEMADEATGFYDRLTKETGFTARLREGEARRSQWSTETALNAIKNSAVFVCCLSKKYGECVNCKQELQFAVELKKKIIFLMIYDLKMDHFKVEIDPALMVKVDCFSDRIDSGQVYKDIVKVIGEKVKPEEIRDDEKFAAFSEDFLNRLKLKKEEKEKRLERKLSKEQIRDIGKDLWSRLDSGAERKLTISQIREIGNEWWNSLDFIKEKHDQIPDLGQFFDMVDDLGEKQLSQDEISKIANEWWKSLGLNTDNQANNIETLQVVSSNLERINSEKNKPSDQGFFGYLNKNRYI